MRDLQDVPANVEAYHQALLQIALGSKGEEREETEESRGGGGREREGERLLKLAETELELFHSPAGQAFAVTRGGPLVRTFALDSREFTRWLSRRFYRSMGRIVSKHAVREALGVLEGRAVYDSPQRWVYLRMAEKKDALYLDLGNRTGTAVEMRPQGWRLAEKPSLAFWRPPGLQPLPAPAEGGSLQLLRPLLNVSDEDWPLVVAWLVAAMRPVGPYPVLILSGPPGSGKSMAALMLRSLIDPSTTGLRSMPETQRELIRAASRGWCVAIDNLSQIPDWLSDGLCRLASGGGFSDCQLFTDREEMQFYAQRPVILTTADDVSLRTELANRAMDVALAPLAGEKRRYETELWPAFEKARAQILGGLCSTVCAALGELPKARVGPLPRLADFVRWVSAAEAGLPWRKGTIEEQYESNRERLAAKFRPSIMRELVRWSAEHLTENEPYWIGTSTDLLEVLEGRVMEGSAGQAGRRKPGWPRNPRELSAQLRAETGSLTAAGIVVSFDRSHDIRRTRLITLRRMTREAGMLDAGILDAVDAGRSCASIRKIKWPNVLDAVDALDAGAQPENNSDGTRWGEEWEEGKEVTAGGAGETR